MFHETVHNAVVCDFILICFCCCGAFCSISLLMLFQILWLTTSVSQSVCHACVHCDKTHTTCLYTSMTDLSGDARDEAPAVGPPYVEPVDSALRSGVSFRRHRRNSTMSVKRKRLFHDSELKGTCCVLSYVCTLSVHTLDHLC